MIEIIVKAMDEKKAEDIRVLDLKGLSNVTDYYVICSGRTGVMAKAIVDNVEVKMEEEGIRVIGREGRNQGKWILLDYGSIVAHVFEQEERDYYEIERLWGDAEELDIQDMLV